MSDAIPEKLGKYEILGVAGKGAQGIVLRGHDPFVDREVAIKLCRLENAAPETAATLRRFFFNEAQAAGQLDHPNILRVYDAGETDSEPFIVMEFVPGSDTLRSYIKAPNLLEAEQAIAYVQQCAEALDYAHHRGVIHRDIKPANIMLTPEGTVKLVDFGIAYRSQTDKTQLAGGFGSPRYMSPEQARGDDVTPQSDLFSLGTVLYELLSGAVPFEAKNIAGMIYQIVHGEPRPLREVAPGLPDAVVRVVERALEKDTARRYRTGGEMAEDLARALTALESPEASLSDEDKLGLLRKLDFFADFSESELEEVLAEAGWESHRAQSTIVADGVADRTLFIVVSGTARLVKGGVNVIDLTPGDCFGELGYLEGLPAVGSVTATARCTVLRIEEEPKAWASLPCQLRFSARLQRTVVERLAEMTARLAEVRH